MIKQLFCSAAAGLTLVSTAAPAQQYTPPPSEPVTAPPEPDAIPLYGPKTPGSPKTEIWNKFMRRDLAVRNVTFPTLTPVLPDPAKATGAAVVVTPGGAFMLLAIDLEGNSVAHALAKRGIAAFVLKYRLLPTPKAEADAQKYMLGQMVTGLKDPSKPPTLQNPDATTDALAALALVRNDAAKWHIDPKKVGMIGFSAGAMTTLNATLTAKPGEGPDFVGYIYGPQVKVEVPASAPPLFDAIAMDDPLFPSTGFSIVDAWHAAKKPVELHAYQKGGHGFGLGVPGTTTTLVLDEFTTWLAMNGIIPQSGGK